MAVLYDVDPSGDNSTGSESEYDLLTEDDSIEVIDDVNEQFWSNTNDAENPIEAEYKTPVELCDASIEDSITTGKNECIKAQESSNSIIACNKLLDVLSQTVSDVQEHVKDFKALLRNEEPLDSSFTSSPSLNSSIRTEEHTSAENADDSLHKVSTEGALLMENSETESNQQTNAGILPVDSHNDGDIHSKMESLDLSKTSNIEILSEATNSVDDTLLPEPSLDTEELCLSQTTEVILPTHVEDESTIVIGVEVEPNQGNRLTQLSAAALVNNQLVNAGNSLEEESTIVIGVEAEPNQDNSLTQLSAAALVNNQLVNAGNSLEEESTIVIGVEAEPNQDNSLTQLSAAALVNNQLVNAGNSLEEESTIVIGVEAEANQDNSLTESSDAALINNQLVNAGNSLEEESTIVIGVEAEANQDNSLTESSDAALINNQHVNAANTLKITKKLVSPSGEEYIKKKEQTSKQSVQLNFSARFTYANMEIKLHNDGCLMTADGNFVAKIEIEQPHLLDKVSCFRDAKSVLLNQIRVVRILLDDQMVERTNFQTVFKTAVKNVMRKSATDYKYANDCIQLSRIIETKLAGGKVNYRNLCTEIIDNHIVSNVLKRCATQLFEVEKVMQERDQMFARFGLRYEDNSIELSKYLNQLYNENAEHHKEVLLTKTPSFLKNLLTCVNRRQIMLINSNDVKLFMDMESILNQSIFKKPLEDLAKRWINQVKSTKINETKEIVPLTNSVYFFLCKSLEELIVEIGANSNVKTVDLLSSDDSGWHPIKKITWKSENSLTKCLEREYNFIFKLLKHFDLGSSVNRKPFEYTAKLFNGSENKSKWKNMWDKTKKLLGYKNSEENQFGIADELYVWYCLLDDALAHVLPGIFGNNEADFDIYDNIMQGYIKFVCSAGTDQLETLRVITHNTARFVVQTSPYLKLQGSSSSIDMQVLQKQLDIINSIAVRKALSANNFRDLVDVFNCYWKVRGEVIESIPSKINLSAMNLLKERLLNIVVLALGKEVETEEIVAFFRAYNDFLVDLNDIQFDWFIKSMPDVNMKAFVDLKVIELIENKWIDTDNRTYRVSEAKKFSELVRVLCNTGSVPKHYVIEIVTILLSFVELQLNKCQWVSGASLSDLDRLTTTNELMFAVRSSLLYLKEQADYVSFELFFDESIKPFSSVVDNSTSHRDFTNRMSLIKESLWYIRKQNEMDIERALVLYKELNNNVDDQLLRQTFQTYTDQFELYMQTLVGAAYSTRAYEIAEKVEELVETINFTKWDSKFKQEIMPKILAGLAAVWSILVSKDVSSTGRYLKPHCIQIICVLKLLSADNAEKGVAKHLAQVLTGQGKSLVLGLTAALLALTGHDIRIVCYNGYLVSRDELDFRDFFEYFDVKENIIYSTFDDMANAIIFPEIDGQRVGLRTLIGDLLTASQSTRKTLAKENLNNSILLMDEVDVFFTKEFYGSVYVPITNPRLPGVDKIQQEIWNLISRNNYDAQTTKQLIYEYIESSGFEEKDEFVKFLNMPTQYNLLVNKETKHTLRRYTNECLFDEHLTEMISCALEVKISQASNWTNYKLSDRGTITFKSRGVYVNHVRPRYYMIFNYFRLKQSDFTPEISGELNYGYLNIVCGSISYAMLPKNYPLILGVSGTLTDLNQHERNTIEKLYSIVQSSAMPTFFGCSNLQFNELTNFTHFSDKSHWMSQIFSRANGVLGANRSVLVFFESDAELNEFHAEYSGQFDRLNVLTENTEAKLKQQYINESGVAKTITLATRGMGRGVDYKSSVAVEKNGGVHVIQTFFSMDIKEETQIRGRTARKDNKGSYELIVCESDLKKSGIYHESLSQEYFGFHEARNKITLRQNECTYKAIEDATHNHDVTMKYMQSFMKA